MMQTKFPQYVDQIIDIPDDPSIALASRDQISIFRIIGISASMLSYQIAYSIEFAITTPLMKSLNFSHLSIGLLWLAGPLSGFFIQPLFGGYSDTTRLKLGRRRPFILTGLILTTICMIIIYFLKNLISNLKFPYQCIIMFIVLMSTNISINVIQVPARAIVGDLVPFHQQALANVVGSTLLALAAVLANLLGGISYFVKIPWITLNEKQFIIITGTVLIVIFGTITLLVGTEEQLLEIPARENPFVEIYRAFRTMPKPIYTIRIIYALSWVAYFPFQTITTDFFGSSIFNGSQNSSNPDDVNLYNKGVSFGMLVISISNFLVLIYGFIHEKLRKVVGLRWSYFISQIITAISLSMCFFVKNKWVLMGTLSFLGVSSLIFNAIPFEIVARTVALEQMGTYMGVLNSFAVFGQIFANFAMVSGVGSIRKEPGDAIGAGCIFAIIAAVYSLFLNEPTDPTEILKSSITPYICDPIR